MLSSFCPIVTETIMSKFDYHSYPSSSRLEKRTSHNYWIASLPKKTVWTNHVDKWTCKALPFSARMNEFCADVIHTPAVRSLQVFFSVEQSHILYCSAAALQVWFCQYVLFLFNDKGNLSSYICIELWPKKDILG